MRRVDNPALGPGGEFDRIRRILAQAPLDGPGVLLGAGDDAALVAGGPWAISVDMAVEDVHFRRKWLTPFEIGFRSVMAAASDMAAMAADPRAVLTSVAAPVDGEDVLDHIGGGIASACSDLGVALIGGDLTRSPGPLVIDTVILGQADRPVGRGGAFLGDEIWVTGALGAAAAAVHLLEREEPLDPAMREAFCRPVPRIAEARWLRDRVTLRGLIDLSDGLGADVGHLAAAAGMGIRIKGESVPVHDAVLNRFDEGAARVFAMSGGEDYELCCVVPRGEGDAIVADFRSEFDLLFTCVGWVTEETGVRIVDLDGREHPAEGFDHFQGESRG